MAFGWWMSLGDEWWTPSVSLTNDPFHLLFFSTSHNDEVDLDDSNNGKCDDDDDDADADLRRTKILLGTASTCVVDGIYLYRQWIQVFFKAATSLSSSFELQNICIVVLIKKKRWRHNRCCCCYCCCLCSWYEREGDCDNKPNSNDVEIP